MCEELQGQVCQRTLCAQQNLLLGIPSTHCDTQLPE